MAIKSLILLLLVLLVLTINTVSAYRQQLWIYEGMSECKGIPDSDVSDPASLIGKTCENAVDGSAGSHSITCTQSAGRTEYTITIWDKSAQCPSGVKADMIYQYSADTMSCAPFTAAGFPTTFYAKIDCSAGPAAMVAAVAETAIDTTETTVESS